MSLSFDPSSLAVLLIDLQAWTMAMPMAPRGADEVCANAVRLIKAARAAGATVALARVAFSPAYADRLQIPVDQDLTLPDGGIPAAALALCPEVEAAGYDIVVTKRQWSPFYGTELDLQFRRRRISTVIIGGVMTNFGVEAAARDAWQHNYATVVAEDACASVAADMHRFSIDRILPRVARVRSTAEIVAALR